MSKSRKQTIEEILNIMMAFPRRILKNQVFDLKNDVTPQQWQLVHLVSHNEGIGVKEIAERLSVSPSAATQMIDALADKGFLQRQVSDQDKRAAKIFLSPLCRDKFKAFRASFLSGVSTMFDSLSGSELQIYLELNRKLTESKTK